MGRRWRPQIALDRTGLFGNPSRVTSLDDVESFAAVCRSGGFRQAVKATGRSPSALSDAIRRLEASTGVALLNRTTRSVAPTEAGERFLAGIDSALDEIRASVAALAADRHDDRGVLRLNVPTAAARLALPSVLASFLAVHRHIRVEVLIEDSPVDVVKAGCDAGIRYGELLSDDMTAVPIGPPRQRLVTAASPAYLRASGSPEHPRDLLHHVCLRHRFPSGAMPLWHFERDGEVVEIDPAGPLIVSTSGADLEVDAALRGLGIVYLFEDWLGPHIDKGRLVILLDEWCTPFAGPRLYFTKRAVLPRPLRLFLDHLRDHRDGRA